MKIDSEWKSNKKWQRLSPWLAQEGFTNSRVADVGCNNGYYMFCMLEKNPKMVVGFDPSPRTWFQFQFIQQFVRDSRLHCELAGIENLLHYSASFDFIFCLGVIYHRRDPLKSLEILLKALKPKGVLFIESMTIPGDQPYAFCPPGRYAKAPNIHFVPTSSCLLAWLYRIKFVDVEILSTEAIDVDEQRKTVYAPYESWEDFLDPKDSTKTIEGYPAPLRTIVRARRREES